MTMQINGAISNLGLAALDAIGRQANRISHLQRPERPAASYSHTPTTRPGRRDERQ